PAPDRHLVNAAASGGRSRRVTTASIGAVVATFLLFGPLPALAAATAASASASVSAGQAVVTPDGGHRLLVGWSAAATPAVRARALAATGLAVAEAVTDGVDAVEVARADTEPAA